MLHVREHHRLFYMPAGGGGCGGSAPEVAKGLIGIHFTLWSWAAFGCGAAGIDGGGLPTTAPPICMGFHMSSANFCDLLCRFLAMPIGAFISRPACARCTASPSTHPVGFTQCSFCPPTRGLVLRDGSGTGDWENC